MSGGSSGTVAFPKAQGYALRWMLGGNDQEDLTGSDMDTAFVSKNLATAMGAAITAAPWSGLSAFNPDTDIGSIATRFGKMETLVEALDPKVDWDNMADAGIALADSTYAEDDIDADIHTTSTGIVDRSVVSAQRAIAAILADVVADTTEEMDAAVEKAASVGAVAALNAATSGLESMNAGLVDDEVNAFRDANTDVDLEELNRFAGQMSDINAVVGSGFVIGIGNIESRRFAKVRAFEAELRKDMFKIGIDVYTKVYSLSIEAHAKVYDTLSSKQLTTLQGLFSAHIQGHMQSRLQTYDTKANFTNAAVKDMVALSGQNLQGELSVTDELAREMFNKITSKTNQSREDNRITIEDTEWHMDTMLKGINVLGSLSGATLIPKTNPMKDVANMIGQGAGALSSVKP